MAKPTHVLRVKKKSNKDSLSYRVGVGWINERGWISIQLDPCVTISSNDEVYLNLYPNDIVEEVVDSSELFKRD